MKTHQSFENDINRYGQLVFENKQVDFDDTTMKLVVLQDEFDSDQIYIEVISESMENTCNDGIYITREQANKLIDYLTYLLSK